MEEESDRRREDVRSKASSCRPLRGFIGLFSEPRVYLYLLPDAEADIDPGDDGDLTMKLAGLACRDGGLENVLAIDSRELYLARDRGTFGLSSATSVTR